MKLFFADTETTGLDPAKNELFQLAFLIEIDGKVVDERNIRFRPERPENISSEALEITRKTKEELLSYPPRKKGFRELIATLGKWVGRYDKTDKMIWIGQNPDFDIRFVRALFSDMGDNYFGSWWDPRPADLISLAVASKTRGVFNPPNFKLGSLAAEFGIAFEAHDALADVQVTRRVWHRLAENIRPPASTKKKVNPVQEELELDLS
ncbi:MAG: 3'-5' exonuclease [Elusimicrobiota bacterium]